MSDLEIRRPRDDEFAALLRVSCAAFAEHPSKEEERAYREGLEFERALCAYEGGEMVATTAVLSLELTLPGGEMIPAGGLTWVAVLPTHRRRGLLRRLVDAQFADMAERGEAVSVLLSSEGTIYGRFGYAPATTIVSFSVDQVRAGFTHPVSVPGRMRSIDSDEVATVLAPAYERLRRLAAGAVSRAPGWWREYLQDPEEHREGGGEMMHAVHLDPSGAVDGYVSYRVKTDWPGWISHNVLKVVELFASDPSVYAALWDFVLRTDLIERVSFSRGRVDEPLRWLLDDARAFRVDAAGDYLWLRILDVPRTLSSREYASAGELVLEVTDHFPRSSTHRYSLRTGRPGTKSTDCRLTPGPPDLSLEIGALASAYLGDVSFATLTAAGRVREFRPGAAELADELFSTARAPYSTTMF